MKLTISQRLNLSFGVIIILMIIISIIMWIKSAEISNIAEEVKNDDVPGVILYLQVLDEIGDMQSNVLEYLSGETDEQANFEANYLEFQGYFKQLAPLESANQKDRDKMAMIKSLVDEYALKARRDIFERYNPDTERWAFETIRQLETTTGVELETLLDRLKQEEFDDALKSTDLAESLRDDLPGVRLYLELIDEAGDMLASVTSFTAGDPNKKLAFEGDSRSFSTYLEQLKPLERKPQEIKNLAKIEMLYREIESKSHEIFAKFDPTGRVSALKSTDDMEHNLFDKVEKILDVSAQEEKKDATAALNLIADLLSSTITTLIVLSTIAIFIAVFISIYIANSIKRRLHNVLTVANNISEGNLTSAPIADNSGDEIGEIAGAMNQMNNSLNKLIQDINTVSNSVAVSANEILSDTVEMGESCKAQANRATGISSAIDQMISTVHEVAQQSSDAVDSASDSGRQANEGGLVVKQTVEGINTLYEVVNSASVTVDKLGLRSSEIEEVIQVINGIAEQTNLLALNAAIEAARAGEQGRGFAVVADEVRTLAARTTAATQEVAKTIGAIQQDTAAVIASIKQGSDQANESVSLANKAGESLDTIVTSAEKIKSMISKIAGATESQLSTTTDIGKEVSSINVSATEILDVTNKTSEKASAMNELASQMESLVQRFKLKPQA